MSISLSREDLNREQERQRKRGRLIFNLLKKGKVKVELYNTELNLNPDITFQYQIHDAHFRGIVDYTNGEVICVMDCYYDDIDILNQDGSEITEKLPLWLVGGIETQLEKKFDKFNIELRFMRQSDGGGKKSIVNEGVEEEDQKMIHKAKLIYKVFRKSKVEIRYVDGNSYLTKTINWILPNKFILKLKKYDYLTSQKLGKEKYVVLVINSENIDITTSNGTSIDHNDNFSMITKVNAQFKKYDITVYWSRGVLGISTDNDATEIDLTPKSK